MVKILGTGFLPFVLVSTTLLALIPNASSMDADPDPDPGAVAGTSSGPPQPVSRQALAIQVIESAMFSEWREREVERDPIPAPPVPTGPLIAPFPPIPNPPIAPVPPISGPPISGPPVAPIPPIPNPPIAPVPPISGPPISGPPVAPIPPIPNPPIAPVPPISGPPTSGPPVAPIPPTFDPPIPPVPPISGPLVVDREDLQGDTTSALASESGQEMLGDAFAAFEEKIRQIMMENGVPMNADSGLEDFIAAFGDNFDPGQVMDADWEATYGRFLRDANARGLGVANHDHDDESIDMSPPNYDHQEGDQVQREGSLEGRNEDISSGIDGAQTPRSHLVDSIGASGDVPSIDAADPLSSDGKDVEENDLRPTSAHSSNQNTGSRNLREFLDLMPPIKRPRLDSSDPSIGGESSSRQPQGVDHRKFDHRWEGWYNTDRQQQEEDPTQRVSDHQNPGQPQQEEDESMEDSNVAPEDAHQEEADSEDERIEELYTSYPGFGAPLGGSTPEWMISLFDDINFGRPLLPTHLTEEQRSRRVRFINKVLRDADRFIDLTTRLPVSFHEAMSGTNETARALRLQEMLLHDTFAHIRAPDGVTVPKDQCSSQVRHWTQARKNALSKSISELVALPQFGRRVKPDASGNYIRPDESRRTTHPNLEHSIRGARFFHYTSPLIRDFVQKLLLLFPPHMNRAYAAPNARPRTPGGRAKPNLGFGWMAFATAVIRLALQKRLPAFGNAIWYMMSKEEVTLDIASMLDRQYRWRASILDWLFFHTDEQLSIMIFLIAVRGKVFSALIPREMIEEQENNRPQHYAPTGHCGIVTETTDGFENSWEVATAAYSESPGAGPSERRTTTSQESKKRKKEGRAQNQAARETTNESDAQHDIIKGKGKGRAVEDDAQGPEQVNLYDTNSEADDGDAE